MKMEQYKTDLKTIKEKLSENENKLVRINSEHNKELEQLAHSYEQEK